MRFLATMFNSPGFCDEETYLYLATGLDPGATGAPRRGGGAHWRVESVPLTDVDRLVAAGS